MFIQDELNKIRDAEALFKIFKLTKDQLKFVIGRYITDEEWNNYIHPKQPESLSVLAMKAIKSPMRSISKQASHIARQRLASKGYLDKIERTYNVVKINEQQAFDGKINDTKWKIVGEVDLFQLRDALLLLLDTIIGERSPNAMIRIYFRSTRTNKEGSTTSGLKNAVLADLFNKLDQFMEYEDFNIEEIIFTVKKFVEPVGAGRVNKIISVKDKKSIIAISNEDNLCLARSIATGLLVKNIDKFLITFKGKLSTEEIKEINYKRQAKNHTNINNGSITDMEKRYVKESKKMQEVLGKALHRLANIPINKPAYGINDVKMFESYLNLRIAVYSMEARSIYNGNSAYSENIHILLDTNHYHVITKLDAFEAKEKYHNAARDKKGCVKVVVVTLNANQNIKNICVIYVIKSFIVKYAMKTI